MTNHPKPRPWLAALLSFCLAPLGFLYVGRPILAFGLLGIVLMAGIAAFLTPGLSHDMLALLALLHRLGCAGYAFFLARKWPAATPRTTYSRWYALLGVAAGLTLLGIGARMFLFDLLKMHSSSMHPALKVDARIVVAKWGYGHYTAFGIGSKGHRLSAPLAAGDLLVFDFPRDPSTPYIKRLIGLPGDVVEYHYKRLTVNGKAWPLRKQSTVQDKQRLTFSTHFIESNGAIEYRIQTNNDMAPYEPSAVFDFPYKNYCKYEYIGFRCTVPQGHYFVMGDNRDNSLDSRYWGFVPASHIVGKVVHIVQ